MKILVVSNMYPDINNPSYGIFVKRFCSQLESLGIEYQKSVMYKSNNFFVKIFSYIRFYLETIIKIFINTYDVIYVHYASHSAIPIIIASKFKKIKVFTNVHGSDVVPENKKQEKFQKLTKKLLDLSYKIIVPSQYFKGYIIKKYKLDIKKIHVYPSAGVDPLIFQKYDRKKRESIIIDHGLKETDFIIGFVGRITKGKGWDTLIKGLEIFYINNNNLNFKVVIVGSGTEEEKLDLLIKKSKISNKIIRFKLLDEKELADIYNILSILVFPTEREGESLGLVALEAMSCGIPIISSNFAAPKYYIKDGYNGYKYEVGNYKELSECIEKYLLLNNNDKKEMSSNACITANEFLEDNIIQNLKLILS